MIWCALIVKNVHFPRKGVAIVFQYLHTYRQILRSLGVKNPKIRSKICSKGWVIWLINISKMEDLCIFDSLHHLWN